MRRDKIEIRFVFLVKAMDNPSEDEHCSVNGPPPGLPTENVSQLEFIGKLEDGWGDRDDCIAVPARAIEITRETMQEFLRLHSIRGENETASKFRTPKEPEDLNSKGVCKTFSFRITPGFDGEIDVALMPGEHDDGPVMVTFSEESMLVCEARYKFVPTEYEFKHLPGCYSQDDSWIPSYVFLANEIYDAEQRAISDR
jgi:hypothetical protein